MKVSVSKLEGHSGSGPAILTFRPDPDTKNETLNGGILVGLVEYKSEKPNGFDIFLNENLLDTKTVS